MPRSQRESVLESVRSKLGASGFAFKVLGLGLRAGIVEKASRSSCAGGRPLTAGRARRCVEGERVVLG
eukprot:365519-Chlamydomonas_euryale.AAC.1